MMFTIPYPPSTNTLFRNVPGRGRVKTARYKTWMRAAKNEIMAQRAGLGPFPIACPVDFTLEISLERKGSDLDNRLKAPIDALVAAGILQDDKFIARLSAAWSNMPKSMARVELRLCQAPEDWRRIKMTAPEK